MSVLFLYLFSLVRADAQTDGDILCNMVSANGQHVGMPHIAVDVNGEVACAAADVTNANAHVAL